MTEDLNQASRPAFISGPAQRVMATLTRNPAGMTGPELAKELGIDRSLVSRSLRELGELGMAHIDHYAKITECGKPSKVFRAGPSPRAAGEEAPLVTNGPRRRRGESKVGHPKRIIGPAAPAPKPPRGPAHWASMLEGIGG